MENEALVLRARAELAKLQAEYATDDVERRVLSERSRAYDAQASQLEELLTGPVHKIYGTKRRPDLVLAR
jgi:hypothetical protein